MIELPVVMDGKKTEEQDEGKGIQEASGVPNGSLKAQRRRPPAIDAMA